MRGQNLREVKIADLHQGEKETGKISDADAPYQQRTSQHISGRKSVS